MKKSKLFIFFIVSFFLWGCKKNSYTHEYLLQHPTIVNDELAQCRQEPDYTAYCDMVKNTRDEFEALIAVRAENPELFGKQILAAQLDVSLAKEKLVQAEINYKKNKTQQALDELMKAKKSYSLSVLKVNTLLAVVKSMSGPNL